MATVVLKSEDAETARRLRARVAGLEPDMNALAASGDGEAVEAAGLLHRVRELLNAVVARAS